MLVLLGMFAMTVVLPLIYFYLSKKVSGGRKFFGGVASRGKIALFINIASFALVFFIAVFLIFTGQIYADTPAEGAEGASELALMGAFIGAGLVTGMGAIGTGIAVSSAAAAAIGAISENENNFGKSMIFVAMAEGIAIYGLLISFMILGRV